MTGAEFPNIAQIAIYGMQTDPIKLGCGIIILSSVVFYIYKIYKKINGN